MLSFLLCGDIIEILPSLSFSIVCSFSSLSCPTNQKYKVLHETLEEENGNSGGGIWGWNVYA